MRTIEGIISGVSLVLKVPETFHEYSEGARLSSGLLNDNEGYLFNFRNKAQLAMENSGVLHALTLLYFYDFKTHGIVEEVKTMEAGSGTPVYSTGHYPICLELRTDFCERNALGVGSILSLKESL